jgi:hypothetical protein
MRKSPEFVVEFRKLLPRPRPPKKPKPKLARTAVRPRKPLDGAPRLKTTAWW